MNIFTNDFGSTLQVDPDLLKCLCNEVLLYNVKWVSNFFYRSPSFCFFREKFGFE